MNIINLFTARPAFFFFAIVFRVILDFSYIYFVSDLFGYAGFLLNPDVFSYQLSWVLYCIIMLLTPHMVRRPSDYFFMTAFLSLIAPLTSLFGLSGKDVYPVLITLSSIVFIRGLLVSGIIKAIKIPIARKGESFSFGVSVFFVLCLIVWYLLSGAVRYFNLDFTKVYEFRAKSAELTDVGVLAYLNGWVYQVFIVYALAWSLLKKKYLMVLMFCLIQVFFFGVTAHKSVFFTPILVVSIWAYFRNYRSLGFMSISFSFVLCFSLLSYRYFNNIDIPSMFIRRVFFVPALLTYDYFNFFSDHEFIYWSNSIFSSFMNYKYDLTVSLLIGDFSGSEASANNGYVSSGYGHFGVVGVFVYSLIIAFVLKVVDYCSQSDFGIPLWFVLCLIVTPFRGFLLSSDLLTTLLTHGLIIAILLLVLSRQKISRP